MTGSPPLLVSLLTPPGRGALAVVGVAGPGAVALVDRAFTARGGRPIAEREDGTIAYGRWRASREDVIAVRHRENRVEVHCHGGIAAAAAVVGSLVAAGADEASWACWLAAAGQPETVVEALETLAGVGGPKAARILSRQVAGALDAELDRIARLRLDGDHGTADAAVTKLLRASRIGLRLARPWRVVVAGAVNAGKSSLVNSLAGHARSIVSPEPGTTRDLVETRLVLDGWEVDLVDTAGLRDGSGAVGATERAGIARADAAAADADLVLHVVPTGASRPHDATERELLVASKIDVAPVGPDWPAGTLATSATTGAGIPDLAAAIITRLVPEERAEPDLLTGAVPFTPRQLALLEHLSRRPASPRSSGRG